MNCGAPEGGAGGVNVSVGIGSGTTVVVEVGFPAGAVAVGVAGGFSTMRVGVGVKSPGVALQAANSTLRQIMKGNVNLFIGVAPI